VGAVDGVRIDPKSFEAVVMFSVRDDIRLPKDSAAIITSESLLAANSSRCSLAATRRCCSPAVHHHYPGVGKP